MNNFLKKAVAKLMREVADMSYTGIAIDWEEML